MTMEHNEFDVIISGGGLAGASLACALISSGFRIALIEAAPLSEKKQGESNNRAIALTYSAKPIFEKLGIWQAIGSEVATAIKLIEVTDSNRRGYARLSATDVGFCALGWNIEANFLKSQLYIKIQSTRSIQVFNPARLEKVSVCDSRVTGNVVCDAGGEDQKLTAKLLIIAEGSGSRLIQDLNFQTKRFPYSEAALIFNVECDRLNHGVAYEHFLRSGPLALLPVGHSSYAVVWTLEMTEIKNYLSISEAELLKKLQSEFGNRAGQFTSIIGARKSFPLTLSKLQNFVKPRVAIVGNASHTVHPVAGQGFNLALRNVGALAEILETSNRHGWDIGSYDVLLKYQNWRRHESDAVVGFTDGLIRTFANEYPVLSIMRNIGLDVVQTIPPLKRLLLKRTMGLHGRQARLVVSDRS